MDYVLVVKQPAYGSQSAFLAYQLAQLLVQKHQIRQIFFYQDGVSNGNALVYPANDEFNLVQAWQVFSRQFNVPLHLCVAAAQRRGVVDSDSTADKSAVNLADVFQLAGLGEFSQALLQADRVLTL
ncbi:sulfurtransferase complex subunit TusD [Aggregatibacter actinomycetemcomitans]|uniref:sulfurtransferase complex subunit TusD n=1 Tax=Aggregatibacter actinomycetemcomitans TaxID=714 RepID=UPI00023FF1A3|nr:sulfurtransferase complex subunit TusD [Aggregatibacter actinomycetemcomitans]EHK90621.1 sulfur transfer complex subunit TusD [Aggregatibacter actinomycetemcomitans RhAA1]KNE77669.1 sulfur transfer complex subunit TusD [Aggregatibacter actinomycetemcomitans RhAA1]MBN6075990.1 sulfurtransferase complex subunit TusD [Aggregatibacter actinomycetemcomitans]